MVIDNKYAIGEIVYLITDEDQKARIISGINIRECGLIYKICSGTMESEHYEFEISLEINMELKCK